MIKDQHKFFIFVIILLIAITAIPVKGYDQFFRQIDLGTGVKIVGLGTTNTSSPVQVRRGSVISVVVKIKNTGEQAMSFYVGASIIGEGETIWKDLPGWDTTSLINPDEVYTFMFDNYIIPSNAYLGYHGIIVKAWLDSQKTTQLTERWFSRSIMVEDYEKGKVILTFDFESDDDLMSTGYISLKTLNTMRNILNLLKENEVTATLFVQGACLNNSQTGKEFKNIINEAISMGMEMASHSYSHPDIYSLDEQDMEKEIIKTEHLLEELTDKKPLGFRAPYFKDNEILWKILSKKGYLYESAIWYNDSRHPQTDCTPYLLMEGFFEVPLMEADITTDNNWEKPISFWTKIIDNAEFGNIVVLDFHPQNIKDNWNNFSQIIEYIINLKNMERIEVLSISELDKLKIERDRISAKILDISLSGDKFNVGEDVLFKIKIENNGPRAASFYLRLLIIGPTLLEIETYMLVELTHTIFISRREENEISLFWNIPSNAPPGAYSVLVSIFDKDLREDDVKYLDGKGKPFSFMINKTVSYIQVEGNPTMNRRIIHLHVDKHDVTKLEKSIEPNNPLGFKKVNLQRLFYSLAFSGLPGDLFYLEGDAIHYNLDLNPDGSYDLSILQIKGSFGMVYQVPLIALQEEALWELAENLQVFEVLNAWRLVLNGRYEDILEKILWKGIDHLAEGIPISKIVKPLLQMVTISDSFLHLNFPCFWEFNLPMPISIDKITPNGGQYVYGSTVPFKIKITDLETGTSINGAEAYVKESRMIGKGLFFKLQEVKNGEYYNEIDIPKLELPTYHSFLIIVGKSSFDSTPAYFGLVYDGYWSSPLKLDEFTKALENINIAASISVESESPEDEPVLMTVLHDIGVKVETSMDYGNVVINITSESIKGRTVIINFDSNSFSISEARDILVLFDGNRIQMAEDYADILDPNNEWEPEYLILLGNKGFQVIVSIPHFSTHTIKISKLAFVEVSIIGLPPSFSANIYFDNSLVDKINSSVIKLFEFMDGTNHSISLDEYVHGNPDLKYFCQYNNVTVSSRSKFNFEYREQFYLTIDSDIGNTQGEGWYNIGSSAHIDIDKEIPMEGFLGILGAKSVFSKWSGDISSNNPSTTVLMDKPKQVIAVWRYDYSIIYFETVIILLLILLVFILLRSRRS